MLPFYWKLSFHHRVIKQTEQTFNFMVMHFYLNLLSHFLQFIIFEAILCSPSSTCAELNNTSPKKPDNRIQAPFLASDTEQFSLKNISGIINVQMFGASPSADSTTNVMAIIAATKAGPIFSPRGEYTVDAITLKQSKATWHGEDVKLTLRNKSGKNH